MANDNRELLYRIKKDTKSAMCSGLSDGTARKVSNNEVVFPTGVFKSDGPFYCPECFSDVIVRKCIEKIDHFAHKGRLSKIFGSGESQLHKDCKNEILSVLKEAFPEGKWEKERPIKGNPEKELSDVIPDISGRINNHPIVIEIQRSFLNISTILKRTEQYRKRGVAILWIVPLKEDLGTDNFRPRLFEKFLHSMYFGRIYYWQKGFGAKVLPTRYGQIERYIEENSWYDVEEQEERSAGGYWRTYKTIRKPIFHENLIDITKDFIITDATEWEHENDQLTVPKRKIFKDKLNKWWSDIPTKA